MRKRRFSTHRAVARIAAIGMVITLIVGIIIGYGASYLTPASVVTTTVTTTTSPPPPPSIKIGYVGSLTGFGMPFGVPSRDGVMLAIEEINAAGGINGRMLEVVSYDDATDPTQSVSIGTKLINEDKVVAILSGQTDAPLKAMLAATDEAGIPILNIYEGSKDTVFKSKYLFMVEEWAWSRGPSIAQFMAKDLGVKKLAILQTDWEYTSDATNGVLYEISNNIPGTSVVYHKITAPGTNDFRTFITEIKTTGADGLLLHELINPGAAITQIREAGLNIPILIGGGCSASGGNDSNSNIFITTGGINNVEGVYQDDLWAERGQVPQHFVNSFAAKYGHKPDFFAALGYDSVILLVQAIRAKGATAADIRNSLWTISDIQLVTGYFSGFTQYRVRVMPVIINQIRGGAFHYVKTYSDPALITPPPPSFYGVPLQPGPY